jgi:hypothetical protein
MSRRRPATSTVASSGKRNSRVTVTGNGVAARRWRYAVRPRVLRSVVSTTKSLSWSSALLRVLLEELHVDEGLEDLLGVPPQHLKRRQYPQAVAVAVILRHSWRADDLTCILKRLGL